MKFKCGYINTFNCSFEHCSTLKFLPHDNIVYVCIHTVDVSQHQEHTQPYIHTFMDAQLSVNT